MYLKFLKFRGLCGRVSVFALGMAMALALGACGGNNENGAEPDAETQDAMRDSSAGETDDGGLEAEERGDLASEHEDAKDDLASEHKDSEDGLASEPEDSEDDLAIEHKDSEDDLAQESEDAENAQPSELEDAGARDSALPIGERYEEILLSDGSFYCADLGNEELSLSSIREAITDDDGVTAKATKFTAIDLDGDGESEVVLWLQINGVSDYGFEVLRYGDGDVYGYTLPYRTFMNLKTDGTFEFSGGEAGTGIGRLGFSEGGCRTENLAYSESAYDDANELSVQYFANGEACSEEEFNAALSGQEAKADVEWFDLTESGVDAAFENKF